MGRPGSAEKRDSRSADQPLRPKGHHGLGSWCFVVSALVSMVATSPYAEQIVPADTLVADSTIHPAFDQECQSDSLLGWIDALYPPESDTLPSDLLGMPEPPDTLPPPFLDLPVPVAVDSFLRRGDTLSALDLLHSVENPQGWTDSLLELLVLAEPPSLTPQSTFLQPWRLQLTTKLEPVSSDIRQVSAALLGEVQLPPSLLHPLYIAAVVQGSHHSLESSAAAELRLTWEHVRGDHHFLVRPWVLIGKESESDGGLDARWNVPLLRTLLAGIEGFVSRKGDQTFGTSLRARFGLQDWNLWGSMNLRWRRTPELDLDPPVVPVQTISEFGFIKDRVLHSFASIGAYPPKTRSGLVRIHRDMLESSVSLKGLLPWRGVLLGPGIEGSGRWGLERDRWLEQDPRGWESGTFLLVPEDEHAELLPMTSRGDFYRKTSLRQGVPWVFETTPGFFAAFRPNRSPWELTGRAGWVFSTQSSPSHPALSNREGWLLDFALQLHS